MYPRTMPPRPWLIIYCYDLLTDVSLCTSDSFLHSIVVGLCRHTSPTFFYRACLKFGTGLWRTVGCEVRTFTSLILLLFTSKDSHSILWGDVALRFLLTAFHLPRLRVWPPCDVALLLRFWLFHSTLVWLSHLVRFCDVPLLLCFWSELGNESATFFFHVGLWSSSSSSSGDELLLALRFYCEM